MEKANFFIGLILLRETILLIRGEPLKRAGEQGLEANPHWNGSNFVPPMLPTMGAVANRYFVFYCQDSRKDLHFFCNVLEATGRAKRSLDCEYER
jgi:hypothetical protein